MPIIWSAISGHGYGHAAQVVPVLNELGRRVPGLRAILRTTVPESFFRDRLRIPWDCQPVQQDVGCIQRGPIQIDVPATWGAHSVFHAEWDRRLAEEVSALHTVKPSVVVADTPYLACAAGKAANIPVVALASFTWDEVLEPFAAPDNQVQQAMLSSIRTAYGQADLALRLAPSLPMQAFTIARDIGPVAEPAASQRAELRKHLGVDGSEKVVLVGFGGIPLTSLPWEQMERMDGYRFIVGGTTPPRASRTVGLQSLPWPFKTVLASVDAVMTKPGYSTIVETVSLGIPVVYVRRYNFADEAPLVGYLHRYGRGVELLRDDFIKGRWEAALHQALTAPIASSSPCQTGAADAADVLLRYCRA